MSSTYENKAGAQDIMYCRCSSVTYGYSYKITEEDRSDWQYEIYHSLRAAALLTLAILTT
jgi:hypothetical protein